MATTRKDVRDSILARMEAVVAAAGTLNGYKVESSRIEPLDDSDGTAAAPANTILIFAADKVDTPQATYGMQYVSVRTVNVTVEVYFSAATSTAIETLMDAIEAALTTALLGNAVWLATLDAHPAVTWQFLIKPDGGRFRGLCHASFACQVTAEVV